MSSYQNYNTVATVYDRTRQAVGLEIILGCLLSNNPTLARFHVLDAGCGTGNYTFQLARYVGKVTAVDLNQGMLDVARAKLQQGEIDAQVDFHQCALDDLPIPTGSVDAVLVNQVVHHFGDSEATGWEMHSQVIREFSRVLKPGGSLLLNICSRQQLSHGFWFYHLIPQARDEMIEKHIPLKRLEQLAVAAGFTAVGSYVPLAIVMQSEAYLNPTGPLDSVWRDGDSIWSLVSTEQLESVKQQVNELIAAGKMDQYMHLHDQKRSECGQQTFWHAIKHLS